MPNPGNDIIVAVTLDTTTNPWTLRIPSGQQQISVDSSDLGQTITWVLQGDNLADATFSTDRSNPGFEWLTSDPPKPTIFSAPHPNASDNQLSITDHNSGNAAKGEWPYRLCVMLDGDPYYTESSDMRRVLTTPSIRNR